MSIENLEAGRAPMQTAAGRAWGLKSPETRDSDFFAALQEAGGNAEKVSAADEQPASGTKLRIVMHDQWGRLADELSVANMQKLSDDLGKKLRAAFREAGLGTSPKVEFSVAGGEIQAKGARGDLAEIEKLVNGDQDIKENIQRLAYVTEEMSSFVKKGHLNFAREYRQASDPRAVVARYSHLFSGLSLPPSPSTISFDNGVSMTWEGKKVSAKDFIGNPDWIEFA